MTQQLKTKSDKPNWAVDSNKVEPYFQILNVMAHIFASFCDKMDTDLEFLLQKGHIFNFKGP